MEFYKQEKINPMGGCLPILVQIPVFIALFWTLLAAVELRYAPFTLWITDMSVPDPYYILPLLMGVSMWVQSKLSPKPADPIQAKILQIMPVAFSIFFFFFPSGLVIYSLCNNILSIAQQWQITRMFEKKAAEANIDKEKITNKEKPAKDDEKLLLPANESKEENATETHAHLNPTENQDDTTPENDDDVIKPTSAPKTRNKARGKGKRRGKRK
jgi:YidC/Oxa1 family membrane protein insertase